MRICLRYYTHPTLTPPTCPPARPPAHPHTHRPPTCPLQVTSANLERVRKLKTRHQRLTVRCETLRDEVERFLHDDDDMLKM